MSISPAARFSPIVLFNQPPIAQKEDKTPTGEANPFKDKAAEVRPSLAVPVAQEEGKGKQAGGKNKKDTDKKASSDSTGEFWRRGKSPEEQKQVERQITELRGIEMEVKAHEQAHKATGGQYAGGISYDKATGPDGKQYIVGGEVPIDIAEENTPEKTVKKMQIVRSAALAPANPSSQDRSVAAAASSKEAAARAEMTKLQVTGGKDLKDTNARKQEPWMGSVVDISA